MGGLGAHVQRKRDRKGIRAAAKEIGISPTTLCHLEKGHEPDMATLAKVCRWAGIKTLVYCEDDGLSVTFQGGLSPQD